MSFSHRRQSNDIHVGLNLERFNIVFVSLVFLNVSQMSLFGWFKSQKQPTQPLNKLPEGIKTQLGLNIVHREGRILSGDGCSQERGIT